MDIEVTYTNGEKKAFNSVASYKAEHNLAELFSKIHAIQLPSCILTQNEEGIFSLLSHNKKVESCDVGYSTTDSIEINDWFCRNEGKGLTVPVLKDLHLLAGFVSVQTIHSRESLCYWLHMCKKGLIQKLDDVCASTGDSGLDREVEYFERA